jgi:hypothetical protein
VRTTGSAEEQRAYLRPARIEREAEERRCADREEQRVVAVGRVTKTHDVPAGGHVDSD